MAVYPKHRQEDHKGLEIVADYFTGNVNGDLVAVDLVSVVALIDSTAGTPSTTTVAAIPAAVNSVTDTAAATTVSVNAALAAIRNDLATITARQNVILAALK